MNLNQLEAFVRITNNKSFSQTAREMYLTQPTVSASIHTLEKELQAKLFVRTTKGVELTEDGRKIYLYARQIIENAQAIYRAMDSGDDSEPAQPLLIAASTIPAQYLLPKILGAYCRHHHGAQFQVRETDSFGVIREIEEHTADIGFTGTTGEQGALEYIPLCSDSLILITPNNDHFRELQGAEPPQKWLCREPMILRESGSGTRKEALRWLKSNNILPEDLNVVANIGNPGTIIQSVKSGVGISIVSRLAAEEEIESGGLLGFPLDGGATRSIYLVRNAKQPESRAARRFIRVVSELFNE